MGIIDKLKSVFIVDDNIEAKTGNDASKNTDTKSSDTTNHIDGEDVKKFVNVLFSALEKSNLEGFDYLEFMQSITNLKEQKITGDEQKLFQTAYAMAKTMNIEKDKLLSTGQHYLSILESEKNNFYNSLNSTAKTKLNEKNDEINALNKKIEENQRQIAKLRDELQNDQNRLRSITEEFAQAETKVQSVKNGFNSAFYSLSNKIKTDLEKISKYL